MFLELFASPLARRALGALLAAAAVAAIVFSIYHAGKHAGAADEASRQVAAGKSSFERIEADARARLDAASGREQQFAALVQKLSSESAAASGRAAAAQSAAAAERARIAALSDPALRADLAARLGLARGDAGSGVPPGAQQSGAEPGNPSASQSNPSASQPAASAGKTTGEGNWRPSASPPITSESLNSPATLRAIDARLSDCEHLSEQTAALTQQVTALAARDAARESQLTATASERDAALDAYNQLVPLYAQAFRAATHRHRRWFCLYFCSTGPSLNLPPPLSLAAPPPSPPPPHR
jgi:hypothetical protein